jgi:micrococcal nuclease
MALACTVTPTTGNRSPTGDGVDATITSAVESTVSAQPSATNQIPNVITPTADGGLTAMVSRVIDGDTVEVEFLEGSIGAASQLGLESTETVRLLGVDTPETYSSNNPGEYANITDTTCLYGWGDLATVFAFESLNQQMVTIVLDSSAGLKGSFGRLLAYVEVDGVDFNARLVELGYARVYEEGSSKRETDYMDLQGYAQQQSIGLWECAAVQIISTPTITPGERFESADSDCDAAYPGVCIPPSPPNLDCGQIRYTNFTVLAPDPHRFDGDKDGIGCER